MYFKIAYKNVKKSFKDYAIYFITLVLGVALFYMFNFMLWYIEYILEEGILCRM